jgi:hypothetical protein
MEVKNMDNELIITGAFLGPSISGCEVEKIAAGQTRRQLSREAKTMVEDEFHRNESGEDNSLRLNEILIMAGFLGPSISGCEVEKIAAGQTRRG